MDDANRPVTHSVFVEQEVEFTLVELSRACRADVEQLVLLVHEGVLTPRGGGGNDNDNGSAEHWRFEGHSLHRARVALRLTRDLEMSLTGTALVLDLLDEIEALRSRLRRVSGQ